MNTYIINLDKDKERFNNVTKELEKQNIQNYHRIDAILGKDANTSILNDYVTSFFTKFGTKSTIGCALSHIKTWERIKKNKECAMILEDDVYMLDGFKDHINFIIEQTPIDFDIIYFGYHYSNYHNQSSITTNLVTTLINQSTFKDNIPINANVFKPKCVLGLHCYVLSYKGACKLLDIIIKDKIYFHIDAIIARNYDKLAVYASKEILCFQTKENSNISITYPVSLSNVLKKIPYQEYEDPYSYLFFVPGYQVCSIPVNMFNCLLSILMFFIGYTFGLRILNKVTIIFIIFSVFEYYQDSDFYESCNTNNTYILIILFILLGSLSKEKLNPNSKVR